MKQTTVVDNFLAALIVLAIKNYFLNSSSVGFSEIIVLQRYFDYVDILYLQ